MKTFFVIYAAEYVSDKEIKAAYKAKRYAFNTEDDVKVGDRLNSSSYSTEMTVVEVLDTNYKYYNLSSGDLSNKLNSASLRKIRTMKIVENAELEEVVSLKTGERKL